MWSIVVHRVALHAYGIVFLIRLRIPETRINNRVVLFEDEWGFFIGSIAPRPPMACLALDPLRGHELLRCPNCVAMGVQGPGPCEGTGGGRPVVELSVWWYGSVVTAAVYVAYYIIIIIITPPPPVGPLGWSSWTQEVKGVALFSQYDTIRIITSDLMPLWAFRHLYSKMSSRFRQHISPFCDHIL